MRGAISGNDVECVVIAALQSLAERLRNLAKKSMIFRIPF